MQKPATNCAARLKCLGRWHLRLQGLRITCYPYSGDILPSAGKIELLGQDSRNMDVRLRAQTMAVLPQLSLLNFPYSVEEVILLGRTPHSTGHREDQLILHEVMQATDTR